MKRIFYLLLPLFFGGQQLLAQVPEDAVRMSWSVPSGTARQQAIGGAMGSLGGDISSLFANPAGLGFYKTGEFVLSPGISMFSSKSDFRGTPYSAASGSRFNLGTTGFVFGQSVPNARWNSKSFAIGINRIANFNGRTSYQGENDFSSFSEAYAEEFAKSGVSFNDPLYTTPLSFGTKLATYTYLIDTVTTSNGIEVVGLPLRDAILNNTPARLFQQKDIQTKGGITEIAFGFAGNMDDKLYIGGKVGVPIVNYDRTSVFRESDLSGNTNNNFNFAKYTENYSASGLGINGTIGLIVKPVNQLRAGLSISTPTIYGLRERTTGTMEADLENYLKDGRLSIANEDSIYTQFNATVPEYRYDLYSPWKFLVSGSYMINAVEDVTKQKGFITADVEYVTHRSSRFRSADQNGDNAYYQGVNNAIKFTYKNTVNVRVGGELKFNTLMTRLGFAYYGSPYKESELKAHKINLSVGLGYRNKGIFVDLTYVYALNRDVNFPYRLSDKANTFADIRNNTGNVILTVGVKF